MNYASRSELHSKLFPEGIPKLWCPALSYFCAAGRFDANRIAQHLQRLAPHVNGLLVPGSTGEGWEMSDQQIMDLLDIVLPIATRLGMRVLIGVLKTETEQVLRTINDLQSRLAWPSVVGVTVCSAKGAGLTQTEIATGLVRVLELGIPTALYQLPQVTENEMSADTVVGLAREFANFFMFKDTSGLDRVANSQVDLDGVFMVRGSEKNGYAGWLRSVGGNYDGFLLSSANCFAPQLQQMVADCDAGNPIDAGRLSDEISRTIGIAFELAGQLNVGNAFTNANKAIDHVLINGRNYRDRPTPMLIGGKQLPLDLIDKLVERCPWLIL